MKPVIYGAVVITIIATPWTSFDALIIPKIIALSCLSAYLLPSVIKNYKRFFVDSKQTILLIISIMFMIQMIVVMLVSSAPFEQEFFGRTGRGLGFITYFSLFIVALYTAVNIKFSDIKIVFQGLFLACLSSSIYSIFQYFGYDFFDWRTQTNGIIGTLGNPNFQSSFVAIALIPSLVLFWNMKNNAYWLIPILLILLFTLYICESTQGYIAILASTMVFILLYLQKTGKKSIFFLTFFLTSVAGIAAIAGMLNQGPLSYYLYKISVQSRGEMWRTTFAMIKDNAFFGVGLDSLGDYSLRYRDQKVANGIAEYIDNSHNFFLQFAATGGVFLGLLYLGLIVISLYCIFIIQRKLQKFERNVAALIAAWISFQLQSVISPAIIPTLTWNFIFCGIFIGLASSNNLSFLELKSGRESSDGKLSNEQNGLVKIFALILSFFLTYPLYNADKLAKQADSTKDALLAVKAASVYPKSVIRDNKLAVGLFESGLYDLSLEIGRGAVESNPNAYQSWILILINPNAKFDERVKAKEELIIIDPLNKIIRDYQIE